MLHTYTLQMLDVVLLLPLLLVALLMTPGGTVENAFLQAARSNELQRY
jgi:hypothetical protein